MALAGKIFELKEPLDFALAARKLKDFSEEEPYERGGERLKLTTEVLDLELREGELGGILGRDFVLSRYYKRGLVETLVTEEVPFLFKRFRGRDFLIAVAPSKPRGVKYMLADHAANKLSEILFIKRGAIVEARIEHETLRRLHESNPQATRLIWFNQVDFPGVKKLALAGTSLADTPLYREYLEHSKIWYVVFEFRHREVTVGITRDCVVTAFGRLGRGEFLDYIVKDVLPLVS